MQREAQMVKGPYGWRRAVPLLSRWRMQNAECRMQNGPPLCFVFRSAGSYAGPARYSEEARSRREQRGWTEAKAKNQDLRGKSVLSLSRREAARREQA